MRCFSRLRTGLALARGRISVLRAHPHLLWFPGLVFVGLPTGTTAGLLGVVGIGAVAIVGALLLGETLSGIAKTAVSVAATENESPDYFSHVDFGR